MISFSVFDRQTQESQVFLADTGAVGMKDRRPLGPGIQRDLDDQIARCRVERRR